MSFDFSVFTSADAWISLITLTLLEIILGVDNIIFISLTANKLDKEQQPKARFYGLLLAMGIRILLLFFLGWVIGLTTPLFHLPLEKFFADAGLEHPHDAAGISGKDLILIMGGFFLLAKSTTEIHGTVRGKEHKTKVKAASAFGAVIVQIALINLVFSFDSILTAVGLTQQILVMMGSVILSMIAMMAFSAPLSKFIEKNPTLQILALSFLIMIGLTLVLEGFDVHINKAFVYVSVAFSLFVEFLNIRFRKNEDEA
jgi:predicted tellurium resistance membrane protein TerC